MAEGEVGIPWAVSKSASRSAAVLAMA